MLGDHDSTGIPSRHVIKTRTGLVAVVLAVTALLGTGPSISAAASGVAAADVECPPGQVDQRVTAGHQGEDPNTVTLAESQAAESALSSRLQARRLTNQSTTQTGRVTIDVHWHVITRNNGTGAVSRAQIRRQLAVLNEAFAGDTAASSAPTVFRFTTASIDYTANTDWYNWAYPEEDKTDDRQAKRALHRGGLDDLNVYIAGLEDNLLGYATFPGPDPWSAMGWCCSTRACRVAAAEPFNEGDTATHEVGHWLGLLHTFQFGCRRAGRPGSTTPRTSSTATTSSSATSPTTPVLNQAGIRCTTS